MSMENIKKTVKGFQIPERLTSRKFWGAVVTTLLAVSNAWFVAGRPLTAAEIGSIAGIWGIYNFAEGRVDAERAKKGY